jgi:predicted nucleic acid-binding protein
VARNCLRATDAECRRGDPALEAGALTVVVDASVAVVAALADDGFSKLQEESLLAPPLMWSEARSALHELLWRNEISAEDAVAAHTRLEACPIQARKHAKLGEAAWRIADQFGWAKTYDAEYVALAQLLGCRLVTLDARLHRSTSQLGFVVSPSEL